MEVRLSSFYLLKLRSQYNYDTKSAFDVHFELVFFRNVFQCNIRFFNILDYVTSLVAHGLPHVFLSDSNHFSRNLLNIGILHLFVLIYNTLYDTLILCSIFLPLLYCNLFSTTCSTSTLFLFHF